MAGAAIIEAWPYRLDGVGKSLESRISHAGPLAVRSCALIIGANKWELLMHRIALAICFFFASLCQTIWAGEAVRVFSSELMLLESKQVLQPDQPFRYSGPENGADLRKLLHPDRAKHVSKEYFDGLIGNASEPEIPKLIQPLLMRYDRAFTADPKTYEDEYLDTLNWTALILQRSMRSDAKLVDATPSSSPDESRGIRELLASLKGLADSVMGLMARTVREKVSKGLFSEQGKVRALELANQISPVPAGASQPSAEFQARPGAPDLQSGNNVYQAACAACHSTGIAGAPKRGDVLAWAPRIKSGLNSLVNSTLKGKGPMPAMVGMNFSEVEIARAVVYLANSAGGNFVEPTAGGRTEMEKAMWWFANGEHGMSSDSMFSVFSGQNV